MKIVRNIDGSVTLKIIEPTAIQGKGFVKKGDVVTVQMSDAQTLIHYGKAEVHKPKADK
jgi:hypothetical protein